MAFSSVVITFTNDWVNVDQIVLSSSGELGVGYGTGWTWVTTRSSANEVTTGTPTGTAGETAAANFKTAFDLDTTTYTTSVTSNAITITSTVEGEQFFSIYGVRSNTGTVSVVFNNVAYSNVPKINLRSPHFVTVSETNLTRCVLDLYIYTGSQATTMASINYTIDATAYNDQVSFEISQLIRDYLDITFNDTYDSQVVWVNYQTTRYVSDVIQTPDNISVTVAFDGYGYFDDGVNPTLSDRILQSNRTMYVYDGNYFYVPIQQNELSQVDLKSQGVIVDTETFTSTTNSSDVIRYIGYTNPALCGDSTNYLFEDDYDYLF